MNRNLSRRLKRLEERSPADVEPPVRRIRFISPKDMSVVKTLVLGPNGMRTWTDLRDPFRRQNTGLPDSNQYALAFL